MALVNPYSEEQTKKRKLAAQSLIDRNRQQSSAELTEKMIASGRGSAGGDLLNMQKNLSREAGQSAEASNQTIQEASDQALYTRDWEETQLKAQEAENARSRAATKTLQESAQAFQSRENKSQRLWSTGERTGSESYTERQSDIQRQFLRNERLGTEDAAMKSQLEEEDFRTEMAQKEFEYERSLTYLRASIAESLARSEAKRRKSQLGLDLLSGAVTGVASGVGQGVGAKMAS